LEVVHRDRKPVAGLTPQDSPRLPAFCVSRKLVNRPHRGVGESAGFCAIKVTCFCNAPNAADCAALAASTWTSCFWRSATVACRASTLTSKVAIVGGVWALASRQLKRLRANRKLNLLVYIRSGALVFFFRVIGVADVLDQSKDFGHGGSRVPIG
jgi:hypothetical protein